MQIYIALLRGINVSGQKLIRMIELKALFESLNFKNVSTYIQSGNIIFSKSNSDPQTLETEISQQIAIKFGFDVPVTVKTMSEWRIIQQGNPYLNIPSVDQKYLHLTLLSETPEPINIQKIKELNFEPDQFKLINSNIYLFCPGGYGNTKLSNNFFESKLKVKATTRNWNTVNQLLEMSEKTTES